MNGASQATHHLGWKLEWQPRVQNAVRGSEGAVIPSVARRSPVLEPYSSPVLHQLKPRYPKSQQAKTSTADYEDARPSSQNGHDVISFDTVLSRDRSTNVSRNDGNAGARYNDDDGRPDDARHLSRHAWPTDIPRRRTEFSPSCRPWFSPRRERHLHTDASHPGCRPGARRRCPGRPHRPGNKLFLRQTMQARKLTGEYAYSYLSFESDPARGDSGRSTSGLAIWYLGQGLQGFPIKPRVHPLSRLEVGNSFICDRDDSTSTGIAPLTCSSELS